MLTFFGFFICRIESIGSLEIQGRSSTLQGKQITLVDNDGVKLKFLLWGEQVILANLCRLALAQDFVGIALSQNMFITDFFFSVGSMLALDRPYIASSIESSIETSDEFCLEYGSATQLYLVPFVQHEEQVSHRQ